MAWPPPEPVCLSLRTAVSHQSIPARVSDRESDRRIAFAEAEGEAATPVRQVTEPHHNWRVMRDLAEDRSRLEVINDNRTVYLEAIDLEIRRKALEWYRCQDDDFSSVQGEILWERGFRRGGLVGQGPTLHFGHGVRWGSTQPISVPITKQDTYC